MRGDARSGSATIWIDLDNSPHVPFFRPLIRGLEDRGHRVWVTARDDVPVQRLCEVFGVKAEVVGSGRGRSTIGKAIVVLSRAARLAIAARRHRPDIAVSHGSRPQAIAARALGIPAICMLDYEHVETAVLRRCCDAFLMPDRITDADLEDAGFAEARVLRYPGLKEEVYLAGSARPARERPDADTIEVLYRPESPTAHYLEHGGTEDVDRALLERLAEEPRVRVTLVAREPAQAGRIGAALDALGVPWREPPPAEGRELIAGADVVVTGGGTMAREAVVLGVPAVSIFRGRVGAVDRQLAAEGRLHLIRSAEEMRQIPLAARDRSGASAVGFATFERVLQLIEEMTTESRGRA